MELEPREANSWQSRAAGSWRRFCSKLLPGSPCPLPGVSTPHLPRNSPGVNILLRRFLVTQVTASTCVHLAKGSYI